MLMFFRCLVFRILDIYFFCVLLVISFVALCNCTLCFKSAFMVYLIYFHIIDESGLRSIHQKIEVVMKLREVK